MAGAAEHVPTNHSRHQHNNGVCSAGIISTAMRPKLYHDTHTFRQILVIFLAPCPDCVPHMHDMQKWQHPRPWRALETGNCKMLTRM
jgi:hypothetical protein